MKCVNEVIQMQVEIVKKKKEKRVTRAKDPVQVCTEEALPDQWPQAR